MEKELSNLIDQFVEDHEKEILADLERLVRIPSVSKPGSDEPTPFGMDCARVLDEAVAMAREKGMEAKNFDNWYGLAVRGNGAHTVGIFSHLDVVEEGSGWTFPPYEMTRKDGWLFGRGVADDKVAAVIGMYTAKALDELGLASDLQMILYLGVCEEKGMTDIDRYLQEHEQPEFNLVPDFKFPGSIGETGVMKFKLRTRRKFASLFGLCAGEPGKRLPLQAAVAYASEKHDELVALAQQHDNVEVVQEEGTTYIKANGHPETSWGAGDSVNALYALTSFLCSCEMIPETDRELLNTIAGMSGGGKGEFFGIDRESSLFGATKCTCILSEETENGLVLSFDVRYPFELNGDEIQHLVAQTAKEHGFEMIDVQDTAPWLWDQSDPRLKVLCDCWTDVSGKEQKMGVGGGTYARKLKNAVSYGPADFKKCPFIPKGHGEIHSPDETRSVETILNAVKVYIRAFVELDAYYSKK